MPKPKLSNRPPKYAKLKNYAVVYLHGKIHYLGQYGSPESKTAYARFVAESRRPDLCLSQNEVGSTVGELAALFLDHAKATLAEANYTHHRIAVGDFLLKLYNDIAVDDYISRIVRIFSWGVEDEWVKFETAAVLKAIKPLLEGYPGTFDNAEREEVPDSVIRRTLPFMLPTLHRQRIFSYRRTRAEIVPASQRESLSTLSRYSALH